MYKVLEVANKLGVSKVTIYKKMKQHAEELDGHVITKGKITYLDEEGLKILEDTIQKVEVVDQPELIRLKEQLLYLEVIYNKRKQTLEKKNELLSEYQILISSLKKNNVTS